MNRIQEFENVKLGFKVRVTQNEDGSISMNAEDAAIGYGLTRVAKSGNKVVRWERFNGYLKDLGVPTCGYDDYITESIFYLLGMKASNETARKFQMWLATEVIPSIRKHGAYITDNDNVDVDYIHNELRFSQKRTIKTFSNAHVSEIKELYSEFRNYIDAEYKKKTSDRVARYKSVEKGLQLLHDKLVLEDVSNIGDCYNIRKLKEQVILDRTTLEKRISGGEKSAKTKTIKKLKDTIYE